MPNTSLSLNFILRPTIALEVTLANITDEFLTPELRLIWFNQITLFSKTLYCQYSIFIEALDPYRVGFIICSILPKPYPELISLNAQNHDLSTGMRLIIY
jgi:hypothetical protein